jgi:cytochrome P450
MDMVDDIAPPSIPARRSAPKRSPEARGYPVVGILPELFRDAPGLFQRLAWAHPGEVITLHLGPTRAYLVTHPHHVQYILADNWRNFTKESGMWRPLKRLLGNGLVTSGGDVWLRNRRLMQPLFSQRQLAGLVERMVGVVEDDVAKLERHIAGGDVVDMDKTMMQMTQRVLLATMFGTSIRPEEADSLAGAILSAFEVLNTRLFLYFVPERLLPGERALRDAIMKLDGSILRMVRERRNEGEDRGDLLSLLLGAHDEAGSGMDDRQLRDELVTMFVAGNETTAITMTWLLYLLDQHPEIDRKVRDEIDHVLGDRPPAVADLEKLEYCKWVIQESMRMYPPSWILPRMAKEEDQIGGYVVPAGATIMMSQYVMHYHPAFWESPAAFDPERFRPERAASRPRYAYLPFGGGPRQCIGNMFAIMEAQVILAVLRRRVRARLVPGHPVSPKAATTLRPRHGLRMTLHRG